MSEEIGREGPFTGEIGSVFLLNDNPGLHVVESTEQALMNIPVRMFLYIQYITFRFNIFRLLFISIDIAHFKGLSNGKENPNHQSWMI